MSEHHGESNYDDPEHSGAAVLEDYSHIQPLPDPPRKPDMVQRKSLSTIDGTLGPHFATFDDVLLT